MPRTAKSREPLDDELSCRLTSGQKALIKAAAAKLGQRPSDFVRAAALSQAEQILTDTNAQAAWDAFVGCVDGSTDASRDTGKAFAEIVKQKHAAARRRPLP